MRKGELKASPLGEDDDRLASKIGGSIENDRVHGIDPFRLSIS